MTDDTKLIFEKLEDINAKITAVAENQQALEEKLTKNQQALEERLTKNQQALEERLTRNQQALEERLTKNQKELEERLTKRQQVMEEKLTELQLTVENEINKKIDIIAEGHLDLTRKLDDALKVENEKEVLLLRVTSLENEARRLKAKIEHIA